MTGKISSIFNTWGAEKTACALTIASKRFNCFSFLETGRSKSDSNNNKSIGYDFICAINSDKEIGSKSAQFSEIQDFITKNHGQWIFGHINYDIKNSIEPSLSGSLPDPIGFPDFLLFVPKTVVICQGGRISVWGDETPLLVVIDSDSDEILLSHNPKPGFTSVVTFEEYQHNFEKIKFHLQRGDIYEINYCIPFIAHDAELNMPAVRLKQRNLSPAPFSVLYKSDYHWLSCASPERFIRKSGNKIISQPIKGTARRSGHSETDTIAKSDLLNSEKEKAENIMIVDLVRNDLSRIAQKGSVQVDELFGIYEFAHVFQMISTISATLKEDITFTDILKALFPAGSMTGAPKISAMKIIEETESFKRGLFSGTVGYITPNGDFDFNVVIRSILYNEETKTALIPAGGALTVKCNALDEYNECILKAQANLDLLALTTVAFEKAE